jgi:serine protease Do
VLVAAGLGGAALALSVAILARPSEQPNGRVGAASATVDRLTAATPAVHGVVAVKVADGARTGSGVCIGHRQVVTDAGLVGGSRSATVVGYDGQSRRASVIATDAESGLALLRVEQGTLAPARPAAGRAWVGQSVTVAAFGADRRLRTDRTVVAATDARATRPPGRADAGLLVTAIPARGRVGGAVLDSAGRVVGVVLASGKGDRTARATPIARVLDIARQLETAGSVAHGWLGVTAVDARGHVIVFGVSSGSPAAAAGLLPGDVVSTVDGDKIGSARDLRAEIRSRRPGDPVHVGVRRDGDRRTMRIRLVDARKPAAADPSQPR